MTGRWVSSLLTVSLLLGMGSLSPWVGAQTVLVQARISEREVEELLRQGGQQTRQGQSVQAIQTLERVLEAARQGQYQQLEAVALLGIGRNYDQMGQRQKALESYEQALILFRETNNRSGKPPPSITLVGLRLIGQSHSSIGLLQSSFADSPRSERSPWRSDHSQ